MPLFMLSEDKWGLRHDRDYWIAGSGVCELTNQSRLGIQRGGGAF